MMKEKSKQGENVDGSTQVLYRYWEGVTSAILASAVHNLLVALCEAGTTDESVISTALARVKQSR